MKNLFYFLTLMIYLLFVTSCDKKTNDDILNECHYRDLPKAEHVFLQAKADSVWVRLPNKYFVLSAIDNQHFYDEIEKIKVGFTYEKDWIQLLHKEDDNYLIKVTANDNSEIRKVHLVFRSAMCFWEFDVVQSGALSEL
ncbi:hypothetical protein [Flavobacterium sp. NKUCC04_CG]|uniref:hypothetical protein n=1 Tax=Flavobacterium sp. NKUCC04_CG TaxID=2842121 RepID=UPI001C5A851E|nr:hypothetical protein [Flavobacterium sp. NKUCC04_CG]MBW3520405.1 hypothetical protein [Flavobacterium sp. NKUCC04_CG]